MAITQNTREYEVLIRHNENGKVGAHRQTITEIKDGDTLLTTILNPPEPLTREDLQAWVAGLSPEDWFEPAGAE